MNQSQIETESPPPDVDNQHPEGLDQYGDQAYDIILQHLQEHGLTYTGGCRTFYSPEEWKTRGEQYGQDSVLVVVYDGGSVRATMNMDTASEHEQPYALYEELQSKLGCAGMYFEECTGWYAAIYRV